MRCNLKLSLPRMTGMRELPVAPLCRSELFLIYENLLDVSINRK
jgi:hypothetical protein